MTDRWERQRPDRRGLRRDALAALALLAGTVVSALLYARLGYYDHPAPAWLSTVLIAFHTLPLALRRVFPVAVAAVVSVAYFLTQHFSVPELLFSNITLFVAIYSVGAWSQRRRLAFIVRLAIIAGMFVWIAVDLLVRVGDPSQLSYVSRVGVFSQFASLAIIQVLTNLLYFGGAFYFGDAAWRAAHQKHELETRTGELEAERSRTAQQAVALDRMRIARELHDVVAHHVSVMGVQAGAARRVLTTDAAQASASLSTIEQNARDAVDELHRMLTTLRTPGAESPDDASSTHGLEQLPELIARSGDAGAPAALTVVGDPRPVGALAGFTAYRVVQEALTNTRKHAGDHAHAEVRLRYLPDGVEVEVTDDGTAAPRTAPPGLGLIGMRERVTAVGGTLEIGPRSRGGFLVRARIPEHQS